MPKRISPRRSNRNVKCDILLTNIKYNSRCIDLNLPFSLCCDSCRSILEAESGILKKSSHKKKRYRDLSERRRCQQPWSSEHNKAYKPTTTIQKFVRVRNYLKVDCDIEISNSYINDASKKLKLQEPNITSQCNTEGVVTESSYGQPEVIVLSALPPTQTIITTSSPLNQPPTHDNPPICDKCKLAADSYIESKLRPSNPPSAHMPNADEPTRPAELCCPNPCNE